jgi:hypothetical protein
VPCHFSNYYSVHLLIRKPVTMQTRTCHLWILQQVSLSGQVQFLFWTLLLTKRIPSVPARPQIHPMLVRSAILPALLTLFLDHINGKLCSFEKKNSNRSLLEIDEKNLHVLNFTCFFDTSVSLDRVILNLHVVVIFIFCTA